MDYSKTMTQAEWAALMEPVARELYHKPDKETRDEWRYGSRGSLCIYVKKGVFEDFESGEKGGVVDLVQYSLGCDKNGAIEWLKERGLLPDSRHKQARPAKQDRANGAGKTPSASVEAEAEQPVSAAEETVPPKSNGSSRLVTAYDYSDEIGTLLFQACRFGPPKDFRQRRPDGKGGWTWKLGDVRRVLYRLPELIAAVASGETVFVTEGEKDTDVLCSLGFVATTNPGGAGKWRPEYSEFLRGADVIILPDNDAPGRDHANQVATALVGGAKRVRVLDIAAHWPECPPKGDISDWIAAGGTADRLTALVAATPDWHPPPKQAGPSGEDSAPSGYAMTADGLYHGKTWLAARFEVLGRARDPDSGSWARYLRWQDPDGCHHTCAVSDGKLHGDPSVLCSELAQQGLKIATGAANRGKFVDYLNCQDSSLRVTIVPRTGWVDLSGGKVFVLPGRTLGSIEGETVIFEGAQNPPYAERGSLEEWRDTVGKLTSGHYRAMFTVAASFSAPLAHLVGVESGGVNLFGLSSSGKTTDAQAAASIWACGSANGTHSFIRTWRSTANGLEGAAILHNDLPLVLDELGVADAREVGGIVYTLAGGAGKGRAARDGTLKQSHRWRTTIISTGELRTTDKIAESGRNARAGQEVRIVDVGADAGKGFGAFDHAGPYSDARKLADAIKSAAVSNYGTAGPAFIERLFKEGLDAIAATVRKAIERFQQNVPAGADGQVRRVAERFGLIAAAGELAIQFGIVPWPQGSARDAATRLFASWLDGRGGIEPAEIQKAIAQVRGLIERYGSSRFDPADGGVDRPVLDRLGWHRGSGEEREWLIPSQNWKDIFALGYEPTMVARALSERGMLDRASDGFARSETVDGKKRRVYVLTSRIAEGSLERPEAPSGTPGTPHAVFENASEVPVERLERLERLENLNLPQSAVCGQCHAGDDELHEWPTKSGPPVRLHRECRRFWLKDHPDERPDEAAA